MIERPKRSVTRFFVPLIDVMILLFCMFILMPFVTGDPKSAEPGAETKDAPPAAAQSGASLSDRVSVKVLEIDPSNGKLYSLQNGQRIEVNSEPAAESVITLHKRQSAQREPFFLILYPRQRSGYPEQQQADDYARWFRGVQFQFDRPFAPAP